MKKSFPVVVYVTHGKQELQKKKNTVIIFFITGMAFVMEHITIYVTADHPAIFTV